MLVNKYKRIYDCLILKAQQRGRSKKTAPCYVEMHHIIPVSLGGDNTKQNLVVLTAKEHIVAHKLLWKFWPCPQTAYAAFAMNQDNHGKRISSTLLASVRQSVAREQSERMSGARHPLFKKGHSEKSRKKMSLSHEGKRLSTETKTKMSKTRNGNLSASRGVYYTPAGSGRSLKGLAIMNKVSGTTVQKRCKLDSDKMITSRKFPAWCGMTWRELGWYFVPDHSKLPGEIDYSRYTI